MAILPNVSTTLESRTLTAVATLSRTILPTDRFAFYLIKDGEIIWRGPYSESNSISCELADAGTYAIKVFLSTDDRKTTRTSEPIYYRGEDAPAQEPYPTGIESGPILTKSAMPSGVLGAFERQDRALYRVETQLAELRGLLQQIHRIETQSKDGTSREMEALAQLYALIKPELPMPISGWWAMSPLGLFAVVETMVRHAIRSVIEVGSGTSTVWIAYALRQLGDGHVIAFDHDEHFAARTRELLAQHNLSEYATVLQRPLIHHVIGNEEYKWYDLGEEFRPDAPAGLLLVDGPPGNTGERARYPALHFLRDALADDAWVMLDDYQRADERAVVKQWQNDFPNLTLHPTLSRDQALLQLGSNSSGQRSKKKS